jgi:putative ABC transport system substrate-binding protein
MAFLTRRRVAKCQALDIYEAVLPRGSMKRREFITLFASGAAVWPLAAQAQQVGQPRRIGVLMAIADDDPLRASYVDALSEGLRNSGWVEGKNIEIDYRWAAGNADRMLQQAKQIVASRPDAIVAHTSPAVAALMGETTTIPILFVTVTEPLGQGFVKSLAHPGGNVTGFTNFEFSMGGKWLQILKEIMPEVKEAKVIYNPDTAPGRGDIFLQSIAAGAASLAIEITSVRVRDPVEIDAAINAIGKTAGAAGLIIPPDVFLIVNRARIIDLAARNRVPTIYQYDYFVRDGGLVSYGVDVPDLFRRVGSYVDRVLAGASPADLPVQAPTKFQTVLNFKTAKALGLSIPQSLLLRADEVIE